MFNILWNKLLLSIWFTCILINADIGEISIRESDSLINYKVLHQICESLKPISNICEKAINIVDSYCFTKTHNSLLYCEIQFRKGIESCNHTEQKIMKSCLSRIGFIDSKCGNYLDSLRTVCQLESDFQSVVCDKILRQNEKVCTRFKNRIYRNCRRTFEHYMNSCELALSETYYSDSQIKSSDIIIEQLNRNFKWLQEKFELNFDRFKNPIENLTEKLGLFRGESLLNTAKENEPNWIDVLL